VSDQQSAVRAVRVRQLIAEHFSMDEMRGLVFDMGVQPDAIPGNGSYDRSLELVAYCERRGLLDTLIQLCQGQRPHAPWPVL